MSGEIIQFLDSRAAKLSVSFIRGAWLVAVTLVTCTAVAVSYINKVNNSIERAVTRAEEAHTLSNDIAKTVVTHGTRIAVLESRQGITHK